MGNLITYPQSKSSTKAPVEACYSFLLDCKIHVGSKQDLEKLYRNYMKYHFGRSFFCLKSELKRITQQTRLQNNEDLIFIYFTLKSITKVNLMEVFAAITFYSDIKWADKVRFSFKLFDFDGNKNISQDELFIMCKCFIDAVSLLTGGNACTNLMIKDLVDGVPSKSLDLDDLIEWTKSNSNIFKTLNPSGIIEVNDKPNSSSCSPEVLKIGSRANKSFDRRSGCSLKNKLKKRTLSSFDNKKTLNFMVVVHGTPVTKANVHILKQVYDRVSQDSIPNGARLKEGLIAAGMKSSGRLGGVTVYPTFRRFLIDMYPKADNPQITRMLELINIFPPSSEQIRVKSPKSRQAIRHFFNKIDTNRDGVIDIDELKTALQPNFTNQTIEELFKEHSKNKIGLEITDFTEMMEKK